MNEMKRPDTLPEYQASVWPPPPNIADPIPVLDFYRDHTAAISHRLGSALMLFVGGGVAVAICGGILVKALGPVIGITIWVCVVMGTQGIALYHSGKAVLLALRIKKIGLAAKGGFLVLLISLFAYFQLWLYTPW